MYQITRKIISFLVLIFLSRIFDNENYLTIIISRTLMAIEKVFPAGDARYIPGTRIPRALPDVAREMIELFLERHPESNIWAFYVAGPFQLVPVMDCLRRADNQRIILSREIFPFSPFALQLPSQEAPQRYLAGVSEAYFQFCGLEMPRSYGLQSDSNGTVIGAYDFQVQRRQFPEGELFLNTLLS